MFLWVMGQVSDTTQPCLAISRVCSIYLQKQSEGDLSTGMTLIAVLPPSLLGTVVILRFAWALFDSQIRQIQNAVNGMKGSITAGLGLMSTIKEEVTSTKYLHCLVFRYTFRHNDVQHLLLMHEWICRMRALTSTVEDDCNTNYLP